MPVPVSRIGSRPADAVIVPAIAFKMPEPLETALLRAEVQDAARILPATARVHLLKTTTLTADQVADRVGYADGATLRAFLRRTLGMGIRQIRSW